MTTTNTSSNNLIKHTTPNSFQCSSPNTNTIINTNATNANNEVMDLITISNQSNHTPSTISTKTSSPFIRHRDSNHENMTNHNSNSQSHNIHNKIPSPFSQPKENNHEVLISSRLEKLDKSNIFDIEKQKTFVMQFVQNSLQALDKIKFNCDQSNIINNKVPIQIKNLDGGINKKHTKVAIDYHKINKNEIINDLRNSSENRIKNYSGLFKVIKSTFQEIKTLVLHNNNDSFSTKKEINYANQTEEEFIKEQSLIERAKDKKRSPKSSISPFSNKKDSMKDFKDNMDKINLDEFEAEDDKENIIMKKRTLELNKLNMTAINESDERMINDSCDFSETSIQENPHYNQFRSSLRSSMDKRNTNEKDRSSFATPFKKTSNNNTYVEFEPTINNNINNNINEIKKTPQKRISEQELVIAAMHFNNK